MSDAPKAQTALDYCVEIAAHERMADYWTCWDEVAAQYQSPKVLASSAAAELAELRRTVANQAAEIERLRQKLSKLKAIIRDRCKHDDNCELQRWKYCQHGDGPRWVKWFTNEERRERPQCTCYLRDALKETDNEADKDR